MSGIIFGVRKREQNVCHNFRISISIRISVSEHVPVLHQCACMRACVRACICICMSVLIPACMRVRASVSEHY